MSEEKPAKVHKRVALSPVSSLGHLFSFLPFSFGEAAALFPDVLRDYYAQGIPGYNFPLDSLSNFERRYLLVTTIEITIVTERQ